MSNAGPSSFLPSSSLYKHDDACRAVHRRPRGRCLSGMRALGGGDTEEKRGNGTASDNATASHARCHAGIRVATRVAKADGSARRTTKNSELESDGVDSLPLLSLPRSSAVAPARPRTNGFRTRIVPLPLREVPGPLSGLGQSQKAGQRTLKPRRPIRNIVNHGSPAAPWRRSIHSDSGETRRGEVKSFRAQDHLTVAEAPRMGPLFDHGAHGVANHALAFGGNAVTCPAKPWVLPTPLAAKARSASPLSTRSMSGGRGGDPRASPPVRPGGRRCQTGRRTTRHRMGKSSRVRAIEPTVCPRRPPPPMPSQRVHRVHFTRSP